MFNEAAAKYQLACVSICRRTNHELGQYHGLGIMLNEHQIVTARHVIRHISEAGCDVGVVRRDGSAFAATIVKEKEAYDLAELEITEQVHDPVSKIDKSWYPSEFSSTTPMGLAVGLIGRIILPVNGEMKARHYFSAGSIACENLDPSYAGSYLVSGAYCESGCSGGPLFTENAVLVGVIIGAATILPPDIDAAALALHDPEHVARFLGSPRWAIVSPIGLL